MVRALAIVCDTSESIGMAVIIPLDDEIDFVRLERIRTIVNASNGLVSELLVWPIVRPVEFAI